MQKLELRQRQVGPWGMNTYALVCPETAQSILIDPGAEPDTLAEMVAGTQPTAILLTHTHGDHVGALDDIRSRLKVPVLVFPGPHAGNFDPRADEHLYDGEIVVIGQRSLCVRHAPGHCPDQVCLVFEDDQRVVVGDTIFAGGPGKTWSQEGFKRSLRTLHDIVLPWPDNTICFAGHGPSFRLGDLRTQIENFVNKDHGAFFGDATWDQ